MGRPQRRGALPLGKTRPILYQKGYKMGTKMCCTYIMGRDYALPPGILPCPGRPACHLAQPEPHVRPLRARHRRAPHTLITRNTRHVTCRKWTPRVGFRRSLHRDETSCLVLVCTADTLSHPGLYRRYTVPSRFVPQTSCLVPVLALEEKVSGI